MKTKEAFLSALRSIKTNYKGADGKFLTQKQRCKLVISAVAEQASLVGGRGLPWGALDDNEIRRLRVLNSDGNQMILLQKDLAMFFNVLLTCRLRMDTKRADQIGKNLPNIIVN